MYSSFLKKIFIALLLILSIPAWSFQYAVIQKEKAIIYADQKLTSPIGYIAEGKKVKVGEVLRQSGNILPIAISGKIAYIQVNDLLLSSGLKTKLDEDSKKSGITKRSVQLIGDKPVDKFAENNYLVYSMRPFTFQGDWSTISNQQGNTLNSKGIGHYLSLIHRSPLRSFNFGLSLGLSYLKQETLEIGAYIFNLNAEYVVFRTQLFSFELTASAGHSVKAIMRETSQDYRYNTNIFGWGYGMQMVLFPQSKFSFAANYSKRQLGFYGIIQEGSFRENTIFDALEKVESTEFQFSAMYRF